MLQFDIDKMLFVIPSEEHSNGQIIKALREHPEVQYVSFVGIDMGGHDTNEKIPVGLFIKDIDKMLTKGVQTNGSSVEIGRAHV